MPVQVIASFTALTTQNPGRNKIYSHLSRAFQEKKFTKEHLSRAVPGKKFTKEQVTKLETK